MRYLKPGLTLAILGLAALLGACGGDDPAGGSSGGGTQNSAPTANAGAAQTVASGVLVTLNGSASSDSDGSIAGYAWTQTGGSAITLSSGTIAQPTFTAPTVVASTTLTFSLVVTDNRGASSAASTVNVTINPPAANVPPTANAGPAQTVTAGNLVTLTGSASTDTDGTIASYAWTQTAGSAVTLSSTTAAQPTFTAPTVASATTLTFSLIVTDNQGAASAAATVNITVNPAVAGNVNVTGRIRFARPPFATDFPFGLQYGSPVMQPARGIVVRAINAGNQSVIATTNTDANGDYTLSVPNNTTVIVRAVAQLLRDGSQPLPRWDVRVQDGTGGTPYAHDSATFNSGSGVTQNVDIPLGINAAGTATGTRASGPFAIADTIYQGIQLVVSASPQANFPALLVDWGSQATGTFFSSGNPQHIALLANLTADTDEFDPHVVAHEFGHYIEHNFSRADNYGGPHGVGDKLDIRVAFGEGFGYAFAAMVLNDPNARDSFRDSNFNPPLVSGGFDIEDNPPAPDDDFGCWCSESSVWSTLYDLYDSTSDPGDAVTLGFAPLWSVLIGNQRTTPAFTSIFSFMTALKAARPAEASAINALLSTQNIVATGMDIYGSTENNLPSGPPPVASNAVFPLYTPLSVPGTVTIRSANDAGSINKLGNRRYVRFTLLSARAVTITLNSSNPSATKDPDFRVWRAGQLVGDGTDGPTEIPETETLTLAAGEYVIDIYDCANGCNPTEPAEGAGSGDYDLTVTIN